MIIGEIKRHLRDHHAVRVSRSLRDIAYKAMRAKEQFINDNLKEPRLSDLAEATGIPEDDILFALDAIQDPMSLHEPINGGEGDPVYMMDQLQDKTVSEERWSTYVSVKETVSSMDDTTTNNPFKTILLWRNTNRNCERTWYFTSTNFKTRKKCSSDNT